MNNKELELIAYKIRKHALIGVHSAKSGHPGGSLSIAEILSVLYFDEMNVDANNPKNPDRDRFVLSKGHCAPALYGALAEKGYFPKEDIRTLRQADSYLQGHPDMKHIPGVDMSTGSLGQGICAANGMALAAKLDGKSYRVYAIWATENVRKVRCGRRLCLHLTTNWTTLRHLLTLTDCRLTAT